MRRTKRNEEELSERRIRKKRREKERAVAGFFLEGKEGDKTSEGRRRE